MFNVCTYWLNNTHLPLAGPSVTLSMCAVGSGWDVLCSNGTSIKCALCAHWFNSNAQKHTKQAHQWRSQCVLWLRCVPLNVQCVHILVKQHTMQCAGPSVTLSMCARMCSVPSNVWWVNIGLTAMHRNTRSRPISDALNVCSASDLVSHVLCSIRCLMCAHCTLWLYTSPQGGAGLCRLNWIVSHFPQLKPSGCSIVCSGKARLYSWAPALSYS